MRRELVFDNFDTFGARNRGGWVECPAGNGVPADTSLTGSLSAGDFFSRPAPPVEANQQKPATGSNPATTGCFRLEDGRQSVLKRLPSQVLPYKGWIVATRVLSQSLKPDGAILANDNGTNPKVKTIHPRNLPDIDAGEANIQHRRSTPRRFNSSHDRFISGRGNAPKLRSVLADTSRGGGTAGGKLERVAWQNRSETTGSIAETVARAIAGLHKACHPRKQLHHAETGQA